MIYQAVKLLAQQLNNNLKIEAGDDSIPDDFVQLRNVAHLTADEISRLNNVLITLVIASEDIPVKHFPDNTRNIGRGASRYLSLYVLISSCVYHSYDQSLLNLSHIINFFDNNGTFTWPVKPGTETVTGGFRLTVENYSPSFEETSNLWTTMGGRQFPHMVYRVRMAELPKQNPVERRGIIKQFEARERVS
ncbi:Pvc16 family protein [Mucilaginibacter ginsenosidivorax]|uniref:DUF4255 domain-containing protein n=1 Tax=Mucilaginibacter ginsenosidivorax TaxID=862126 RepID=A0A5B8W377_9SPHI|nr:Pvc16 family protein [Mucilaginibacter ginsenosidivorax]QEC77979.1 DUF4255 domain-containing protein [Mucilaginibacter ginsenosidivorax]